MRAMRGFQAFQDRPVVWYAFAALAVAGQCADIIITLAVLARGGAEANPLAAYLMTIGGWPILIGAKLALALALAWTLCAFALSPTARRSWAGALTLCVAGGFAVGWWGVIGNNIAIWLIASHVLL